MEKKKLKRRLLLKERTKNSFFWQFLKLELNLRKKELQSNEEEKDRHN